MSIFSEIEGEIENIVKPAETALVPVVEAAVRPVVSNIEKDAVSALIAEIDGRLFAVEKRLGMSTHTGQDV